MNTGWHVLGHAVSGAAFGAAISAGWQAISNWAHERKQKLNKANIVDFALNVGIISALIGYYTGKSEQKEYVLKMENSELKQQIADLHDKKSRISKSFVEQVSDSKAEALRTL